MKFDSNLCWKQASSAVAANREVLLALAGVFYMLPSLVLALFFPQPEPPAGAGEKELMAIASGYYLNILPIMIPMVLFQAAGTLALLTMLTDRTRPTVGEAIRLGLQGIIPYFAAQLLLGAGIGIIGGLVLAIAAATGVAAIGVLGGGIVLAIVIYAIVRTSLVGPVIAVENERNPIKALKRSWALTERNAARIGLFYLLVGVAFLVVIMVISLIVGIPLQLLANEHVIRVVGGVISSALNAAIALYFVAIIAAVHRQLAGPSAEAVSVPFD